MGGRSAGRRCIAYDDRAVVNRTRVSGFDPAGIHPLRDLTGDPSGGALGPGPAALQRRYAGPLACALLTPDWPGTRSRAGAGGMSLMKDAGFALLRVPIFARQGKMWPPRGGSDCLPSRERHSLVSTQTRKTLFGPATAGSTRAPTCFCSDHPAAERAIWLPPSALPSSRTDGGSCSQGQPTSSRSSRTLDATSPWKRPQQARQVPPPDPRRSGIRLQGSGRDERPVRAHQHTIRTPVHAHHREPAVRTKGEGLSGSRYDPRRRRPARPPRNHSGDECGKLPQAKGHGQKAWSGTTGTIRHTRKLNHQMTLRDNQNERTLHETHNTAMIQNPRSRRTSSCHHAHGRQGQACGGRKRPSLTAAARDGAPLMWAGTEEWLCGPNKRMRQKDNKLMPIPNRPPNRGRSMGTFK